MCDVVWILSQEADEEIWYIAILRYGTIEPEGGARGHCTSHLSISVDKVRNGGSRQGKRGIINRSRSQRENKGGGKTDFCSHGSTCGSYCTTEVQLCVGIYPLEQDRARKAGIKCRGIEGRSRDASKLAICIRDGWRKDDLGGTIKEERIRRISVTLVSFVVLPLTLDIHSLSIGHGSCSSQSRRHRGRSARGIVSILYRLLRMVICKRLRTCKRYKGSLNAGNSRIGVTRHVCD